MAVRPGLTTGPAGWLRLLWVVGAVLALHGLALDWFARQQVQQAPLRALPPPVFTRLLRPQAPPAPPTAPEIKRPVARIQSGPTAMNSIASAPIARTPTVAPAEPVAAVQTTDTVVAEAAPATPAATTPTTADTTVAPPPDTWPADTRLNYKLSGRFRSGPLYGGARVQWQRDGSRYEVRVEIDVTLLASLVMTSQGEVTPQGLQPSDYQEQRRGGTRGAVMGPREIMLAGGRAVPRPDGVQDTASQFVELSHRFATGVQPLEVGQAVSVWMARPGAVDLWTYDVVEREMLETKLGAIEAFRLKPRPIANPRGNITAELWFAPSLQHLPVRIRVSMGEEAQVDLLVESIEQR